MSTIVGFVLETDDGVDITFSESFACSALTFGALPYA